MMGGGYMGGMPGGPFGAPSSTGPMYGGFDPMQQQKMQSMPTRIVIQQQE